MGLEGIVSKRLTAPIGPGRHGTVESLKLTQALCGDAEVGLTPELGKILGRLNLHEPLHTTSTMQL
jgi:hypothetical protein